MTIEVSTLELEVEAATALTDTITAFRLRDPGGAALPAFTPGAHLRVQVEVAGKADWRHYSLINGEPRVDATDAPASYHIAVRRDDGGRGGSKWMHAQLKVGSRLVTSAPLNAFALDPEADDAVLIAGGIGVTPLISMAAALAAAGRRYRFHYGARHPAQLAYAAELRALAGEALTLYADEGETLPRLDLASLLDGLRPTQPLYVCGPGGMIDAVLALASARGWARQDIRFELFAAAQPKAEDLAFEVELRQSGMVLEVSPDQTILDVMLAAGLDPLHDCKRGECGICLTEVVSGEIDHRDYCLSDGERAGGKVVQICVSRARCRRLVLEA